MSHRRKTKAGRAGPFRFRGVLLPLLAVLIVGVTGCDAPAAAGPQDTVSFFLTVEPDSRQTGFGALTIGIQQATSDQLNALLRPDGGRLLIVTSITGYHITPSAAEPFSVVALMGCSPPDSTRGWGAGELSIAGRATTHVTFRPGLVVALMGDESVCVGSFLQSNDTARVQVHGYLVDRP